MFYSTSSRVCKLANAAKLGHSLGLSGNLKTDIARCYTTLDKTVKLLQSTPYTPTPLNPSDPIFTNSRNQFHTRISGVKSSIPLSPLHAHGLSRVPASASSSSSRLFHSTPRSLFLRNDKYRPNANTRPFPAENLHEIVVDEARPVFCNRPPFNIFYLHASEYVLPLDPASPGYHPGRALLGLFAVCVTVMGFWMLATSVPVTGNAKDLMTTTNQNNALLKDILDSATPSQLRALAAKADWMTDNFCVNLNNIKERPWTMLTSSISHQEPGHLLGNFFSLFLFMPKVYNFLGPRYFAGLYITGAIGCSIAHCLGNYLSGRTDKPYGFVDTLILQSRLSEEQLEKAYSKIDIPSLGASGSCMAVSAACAVLFPRDKVMMRMFIPIPLAVLFYMVGDMTNLLFTPNSGVAHSGHLGGAVSGIAYIAFLWYSKRLGKLSPWGKYKAHLPVFEYFKRKPNPVVAHNILK